MERGRRRPESQYRRLRSLQGQDPQVENRRLKTRGARLACSVRHGTVELKAVSLSPTLGVEIAFLSNLQEKTLKRLLPFSTYTLGIRKKDALVSSAAVTKPHRLGGSIADIFFSGLGSRKSEMRCRQSLLPGRAPLQ